MGKELEIGKLPNEILESIIISKIRHKREEVLVGSSIGEDTSVLDLKNNYIVLSCDPITGSVTNIGKLGVNISVNDVSTKAAEPIGILLTLLLPSGTQEKQIVEIMDEVKGETDKLNMDIIGGHTEITDVVSQPVLVATVIGKVKKDEMPDAKIIEKDFIVAMSKTAGLEGTAIIAADRKNELEAVLSENLYLEAVGQFENISVLQEGLLSRNYRVAYMHDVTEGGIEGAVWEASKAIGKGISIQKDSIPLLESTKQICQHYHLDPYKLISSGSMLVVIDPRDYLSYKEELNSKGILLERIGVVASGTEAVYFDKGQEIPIGSPGVDELYKIV